MAHAPIQDPLDPQHARPQDLRPKVIGKGMIVQGVG